MSTEEETLQVSVLPSTYWYAPFCCVCLGCCAADFGSSGGTCELPCMGRNPTFRISVLFPFSGYMWLVTVSSIRLVKRNYGYTAWFKQMDSILYIYISWTIYGMWMTFITFARLDPMLSNTTARALAHPTAVQRRQLRAKWLQRSTIFFVLVNSLKLCRRLLCSVRFVFVSTFNLKRGRAFVVGITN